MKLKIIITCIFVLSSFSVVALDDVHFKVLDNVEQYFEFNCERLIANEETITTKLINSEYKEDKSGYFYEFSYEYEIYYYDVLIGDAVNYGEGAESFGGYDEWDFSLNCPI